MPKYDAIPYPVDQIRQWIADGRTHQSIADELSRTLDPRVTAKLIYKVCKRHGVRCQRTGPRSGPGHPEWNGGRIQVKNGYWKVYAPDHPSCLAKNEKRRAKSGGGYFRKHCYVWEHRIVMEQKLGRLLMPDEVVHHKDEDTGNNHPDNLELFESNGKHLKETLKGKAPAWTASGKRNIRVGLSVEHRRALAVLRSAIQRESGDDVPLSNPEIRRYLKRLGKSAIEVSEMASAQALPLF